MSLRSCAKSEFVVPERLRAEQRPARRHGVHPNRTYKWKKAFLDRAASVFEQPAEAATSSPEREKGLLGKIGELTVERVFLSARARATPVAQRRAMIEERETVSLRGQCELLAISRSELYYELVGTSAEEPALMRRLDAVHLEWPFFGARKLCDVLPRRQRLVDSRSTLQCVNHTIRHR